MVYHEGQARHAPRRRARWATGRSSTRERRASYAIVSGEWSKGFATKWEAEAEERRMKDKALAVGEAPGRDRITLADFIADVWLPHERRRVQQHNLDEGTLEANEILVDADIVPKLGPMKLRDVTADTLRPVPTSSAPGNGGGRAPRPRRTCTRS